jgi:hypothetical protein
MPDNNKNGYIAIPRDKAFWQLPMEELYVYSWFLYEAAHTTHPRPFKTQNGDIEIIEERGCKTVRKTLLEKVFKPFGRKKISIIIGKLIKRNLLKKEGTFKGTFGRTIYRIVNYDTYTPSGSNQRDSQMDNVPKERFSRKKEYPENSAPRDEGNSFPFLKNRNLKIYESYSPEEIESCSIYKFSEMVREVWNDTDYSEDYQKREIQLYWDDKEILLELEGKYGRGLILETIRFRVGENGERFEKQKYNTLHFFIYLSNGLRDKIEETVKALRITPEGNEIHSKKKDLE